MKTFKLENLVLSFVVVFLVCFAFIQHKKYSDFGYTTRDDMVSDFSYSQTKEEIGYLNAHSEVKFRLRSGIDWFFNQVVEIWQYGHQNARVLGQIFIFINICVFWFCVFNSNLFQGLLFIFLFYFFMPNFWEHNIITSYPIFFQVAFLFTCIAFYLLRTGKSYWTLLLGSMLLLISNFEYEVIASINLLILLYLYTEAYYKKAKIFSKKHLIPTFFYGLYTALYLSFMLIKRADVIAGAPTDGYSIKFSLLGALKVFASYGFDYFPGFWSSGFQNFTNKWGPFVVGYSGVNNLLFSLVFGFCLVFILYFIYRKDSLNKELNTSFKSKVTCGIALSLGFVLFPQIPISLTSKYQSWVTESFSLGFISSYFSYFGMIALIVWIASFLENIERALVRNISMGALVLFLVASEFRHNQFQAKVDASMWQSKTRWVVMGKFLNSDLYKSIPEGEILNSSSFYTNNTEIAVVPYNYWTLYSIKYGKKKLFFIDEHDQEYKPYLVNEVKYSVQFKPALDYRNSFLFFVDKKSKLLSLFDFGVANSTFRVVYKCQKTECFYDIGSTNGAYTGELRSPDIVRIDRFVNM